MAKSMLVLQYEQNVDSEKLNTCLNAFRENLRDAGVEVSITLAQGEVAKQIRDAIEPPPVNTVG